MAWPLLILAGVMEWGWPLGLKLAWRDGRLHLVPALVAMICVALSGTFLFLAQRELPMGTAYLVWTGIGSIGTLVLGIVFLGEPLGIARLVCASLVLAGTVGLRVFS